MDVQGYRQVTATGEALAGTEDVELIAAPGAGKVIRIQKAIVTVTVAAASAGGEVALEDGEGGTRFFEADADAVRVCRLDFGDLGYPLTANTALNLTVDGSAGAEATARCTVVAIIAND